jgi:hypothetical protein
MAKIEVALQRSTASWIAWTSFLDQLHREPLATGTVSLLEIFLVPFRLILAFAIKLHVDQLVEIKSSKRANLCNVSAECCHEASNTYADAVDIVSAWVHVVGVVDVEATATNVTEVVRRLAAVRFILLQVLLALGEDDVLFEGVDQQVAGLDADGAVAEQNRMGGGRLQLGDLDGVFDGGTMAHGLIFLLGEVTEVTQGRL